MLVSALEAVLGFRGPAQRHAPAQKDEPQLAGSVRYCFDLWAHTLVSRFVASLEPYYQRSLRGPCQLVGSNSIGGVWWHPAAWPVLARAQVSPHQVMPDATVAQRTLDVASASPTPAFAARFGRW